MKYEEPKMEVVTLLEADIITLSGDGDGGDTVSKLREGWM